MRISEAMEVELLDPRRGEHFEVYSFSEKEQFIERDAFTEWRFYVTPKREGRHPLLLKVTVLEQVKGRERKKEIVLEELVVIVAEPVKEEAEPKLCHAGWQMTLADEQPWDNKLPTSGGLMPFIRRYSMVVALLLVTIMGAWAVDLPREVRWQMVKLENTSESYEEFIETYPEGRHVKKAVERKDFRKAVETESDSLIVAFLVKHPESEFKLEARQLFVKVKPTLNLDSLIKVKAPLILPKPEPTEPVSVDTNAANVDTVVEMPAEEVTEDDPADAEKPEAIKPEEKTTDPTITEKPIPTKVEPKKEGPLTEDLPDVFQWLKESMVKVDGGTFKMGCDEKKDGDCESDEKPVHDVTLSGFYISKYEVTQKLWLVVMGENPSKFSDCLDCPVEQVSWDDIQVF